MEQQLRQKKTAVERMLLELKNEIVGANGAAENWIRYQETKTRSGAFIDFQGVHASPKTEEYRNKCDFVIGTNPENGQATIGFLLGEDGTSNVGPIGHLRNISASMKQVVAELEKYIR